MKKFTFKGVLDGFRSSVQAAPRGTEQEIQETLRPDHFQVKKVSERYVAVVIAFTGTVELGEGNTRSTAVRVFIISIVRVQLCCI